MVKYVDTAVTFSEFPDEISLCINISNCKHKCKNCHSQYLQENIGTELDLYNLTKLIDTNRGITCVGLMGGNPEDIDDIAQMIQAYYPELKVGWYTGDEKLSKDIEIDNFDYIKIGPYIEELGGLDNSNTNQRMYRVNHIEHKLEDITNLFWR